jgi:hypothetical protein
MLKSLALYLVLVGIPLAGLFALLDWGQRLVPPPAVGGRWTIVEPGAAACPGLPAGVVLSIEQSGRFLQLRFDDLPAADGRLDDGTITASIPATLVGCGEGLALEATLDDSGRLVGQLGQAGCNACPPAPLVAERPSKDLAPKE